MKNTASLRGTKQSTKKNKQSQPESYKIKRVFKIIGISLFCLVILGFIYEAISEFIDSKTLTPPGKLVDVDGHPW